MVKEAKMLDTNITPELIAEMRAKVGLKLRTDDSVNNEEGNFDRFININIQSILYSRNTLSDRVSSFGDDVI
jgi:hypothetical protein